MDGARLTTTEEVGAILRRHRPGDTIPIVFVDRTGLTKSTTLTLKEDPRIELVPVESSGGTLTPAQKAFRERWLH
jgi:hypothetical protein